MTTKTVKVDFPEEIFDAKSNVPLMHQVVVAQLAAARQGTHKVKSRGEVSGAGRKPFKQKGTGNARQGSIRAPHMTGGGIVHGPTPRDYSQRTPKKMKAAALKGALSDRARHGRILVVDSIVSGDKPKTSEALKNLRGLTDRKKILLVIDRSDDVAALSARNLEDVHVLYGDQLNTYDVLISDDIVFTKPAYDEFVERMNASKANKSASGNGPSTSKSASTADSVPVAPSNEKAQVSTANEDITSATPKHKGSRVPLKDPMKAPKGHEVKVVEADQVYYLPETVGYDEIAPDIWFDGVDNVEAAGFVLSGGK